MKELYLFLFEERGANQKNQMILLFEEGTRMPESVKLVKFVV